MRCLTQVYTIQGLLCDGDADGLPDGLHCRFSVGLAPGAIDVAARLGLESAAITPGFTKSNGSVPTVFFGPGNSEAPSKVVPAGTGLVALVDGGLIVTGADVMQGWLAARWLASTFPYGDERLLSEMAGGRALLAVELQDGKVIGLQLGDDIQPTPDKPTSVGAAPEPPWLAVAPGDLPLPGPNRIFTTAGLLGSSDSVQPDRAGWQFRPSPETTSAEIAALCELAARTGVESTGMQFPIAVEGQYQPGLPIISLTQSPPLKAEWVDDEHGLAWTQLGLSVYGTADQRAAGLTWAAANAGLVEGMHATLFTERAGLVPIEPSLPEPVFDLAIQQEWEVDRFRRVWRQQALPALHAGVPVEVDLRLSEPLAVREQLAEEMAADLARVGIPSAAIRVLSAYKQGFHWLEEEALPRLLEAGPLASVWVTCTRFTPGAAEGQASERALEMEIRWLQEIYPADELLSAALGVPVQFDLLGPGQPQEQVYRLVGLRPDGSVAFEDGFQPVCAARPYLPDWPERGRVHPPTGLLRISQAGRLVIETGIDTDLEVFWSTYQEQVLPRVRQHVQHQPSFTALRIEVAASEDDRPIAVGQERISPLEALHEDLYFYTLDYLGELRRALDPSKVTFQGSVEPWIRAGDGGLHARVRLYPAAAANSGPMAAPRAAPTCRTGQPLPEPGLGIPSDQVIGPDQLPPLLAYLDAFEPVQVWQTGLSTAGRRTWALKVSGLTAGSIAPPQKLSAWRPTLLVNARHHANEVSSTNSILQLAHEVATRPDLLQRVNLVLIPMENVDGAALHYRMQQQNPGWMLHAARFNAAGVDTWNDSFDSDTSFGEARTLPTLWRACQPDIVLDDHGYPSHEWVQAFSGYNSPPSFTNSWWIPSALIYPIYHMIDAKRFPLNGALQHAVHLALIEALAGDSESSEATAQFMARYERYGARHLPQRFPLRYDSGLVTLEQTTTAGPQVASFVGRFPHITGAEVITEVPDETAQGDYLGLCARAHLKADLALVDLLAGQPQLVERSRTMMDNGRSLWRVGRPRPFRP